MGYHTRCERCYGKGTGWDGVCEQCNGTGQVAPYRRWPNQGEWIEAGHPIESWPEYQEKPKHCRVCNKACEGKRRVYCGDRMCEVGYWNRLYVGVHWIKRTLIVQRGPACECCGEVFESPIQEGGPVYPLPWMLQIDHVRPLIDCGDDSPSNLQLLCEPCHKLKTKREAADRAAGRRDTRRPLIDQERNNN